MIYIILADIVVLLHLLFVLFVIFGGILAFYRRNWLKFHLPALIWGVLIETFYFICPLTYLENWLRQTGGESGFSGGFLDYYLSMLLYIDISDSTRSLMAFILIAFNLLIYWLILKPRRIVKIA